MEFRLDFIEGGKDRLEFYERVIRGDVRLKCRVQSFCIRDRSEFYENFVLNPKVGDCGCEEFFEEETKEGSFEEMFGRRWGECFIGDKIVGALRCLKDSSLCGRCLNKYMEEENKMLGRAYFNRKYYVIYSGRDKCGICGVLLKCASKSVD